MNVKNRLYITVTNLKSDYTQKFANPKAVITGSPIAAMLHGQKVSNTKVSIGHWSLSLTFLVKRLHVSTALALIEIYAHAFPW